MFLDKIPEDQPNLLVIGENVELVISEDETNPLAFILPPTEDLSEMDWLSNKNFSLKDLTSSYDEKNKDAFSDDFENLQRKIKKFDDSPVAFNRLANLAVLRGDLSLEAEYLQRASELSSDVFFAHRKGENLISRGLNREAEIAFSKLDTSTDYYANLRLASFEIWRRDYDKARALVANAVKLDPVEYGARLFEGALRLIDGEPAKAVHSFRIAIDDRPNSSVAYTNLAVAYVQLSLDEKAIASLKRAVALNPLNANALVMLADLTFKVGQDQDAVPALRYYVQFEQKSSAIWARLARALLEIRAYDESIDALKRQGSIEKSSAIWNNLGVAYHRKRDHGKSLSAFKYAMTFDNEKKGKNFFLAARNIAITLANEKQNEGLLKFIRMIFSFDEESLIIRDSTLADLVSLYIQTLAHMGEISLAAEISESMLRNQNVVSSLRIFAATGLLSFYSFRDKEQDRALQLAKESAEWLGLIDKKDVRLKERLINNIAYVFADNNRVPDAEIFLSKISHLIHKEPYPTSVLGLIHFRKGNVEKATGLYDEAVHLALDRSDKTRIRQKLYIELSNYWRLSDTARAKRFLIKAIEAKNGDKELINRARSLLLNSPAIL